MKPTGPLPAANRASLILIIVNGRLLKDMDRELTKVMTLPQMGAARLVPDNCCSRPCTNRSNPSPFADTSG
jgi:hypothetical protein